MFPSYKAFFLKNYIQVGIPSSILPKAAIEVGTVAKAGSLLPFMLS